MRNDRNTIHSIKSLSSNASKYAKTLGDPREEIEKLLMEQFGILSLIVRKNPELANRLIDFFIGNKDILIIGGESGMGKSLIAGDIRRIHEDLQPFLPPKISSDICLISWDRTHQAFFEEVSTTIGETISVPSGETHIEARNIISLVLEDQVRFIKKYSKKNIKILIETPLIGSRGELMLNELSSYKDSMQTIITHSPNLRYDTLQTGRLMPTSGQPDAMGSMREQLLHQILGKMTNFSSEAQDEVIKKWWIENVADWGGMVVEWNFEDEKKGYDESVRYFMETGIRPDVLRPRYISYYTRRQFESIFQALPNLDRFIQRIIT